MAVELDWKQIRATYADVGGDGALILHLLPDEPVGVEALDMVTVADPYPVDEPPTKSGWFEGPTGYLILLETDPDERLWQWVATLAENLSAAGVRGTLTGPRNAGWVEWAQPLQIAALRENNRLFGMLAYRPLPSPAPYGPGWGAESTTLESVLEHGLGWALADADLAQVMMNYHPFGLDVSTAAAIFEREIRRHDVGRLTSYISNLRRVRGMGFEAPAAIDLCEYGLAADTALDMVRDLAQQILSAPRDNLTIARVDLYGWSEVLHDGRFSHDSAAFRLHPDLWAEWSPDPCGIQILTDEHLAKAHDLSSWSVTELDPHHWLVAAKELGPWYSNFRPRNPYIHHCDPDTLARARHDFGDMVLTRDMARERGLNSRARHDQAE